MKERHEVVEKFRELRDRYLRERKEQFLARLPINCTHNIRLHVKGKGQFRFCQNPMILAKRGPFLCNDQNTAHRCRLFVCRNTNQSVEQTFEEILKSPSRCGNDYPKLAMLIWFLQNVEVDSRYSRFVRMVGRIFESIGGLLTLKWW